MGDERRGGYATSTKSEFCDDSIGRNTACAKSHRFDGTWTGHALLTDSDQSNRDGHHRRMPEDGLNNMARLPAPGPLEFLPKSKTTVPRVPSSCIERPNLLGRLVFAMRHKRAVLVAAPAGYSKTVSLAQAAALQSVDQHVFWISADTNDSLPRLLTALTIALEPVDVPWKLSPSALISIASIGEEGPKDAAEIVAAALASTTAKRGVIVFDNLHRIGSSAVFDWLDRLLERLPDNWSLVLSSRADPPVALARLRLQGELAEFRSEDLAFSQEDLQALASAEGVDRATDRLAEIWTRAGGWPAACGLALRQGLSASVLSATGGVIFDILSAEVLAALPEPLQRFLIRSSVLPELNAAACRVVTNDEQTQRWLREIVRNGLFVTDLSDTETVLVLHDLFRDFLRAQLSDRYSASDIRDILIRAAQAEANIERRIRFLLEAGDIRAAEEALTQIAPSLLLEDELDQLLGLISRFPQDHTERSAEIAFVAGLCESALPRWSETQRLMSRAARLFADASNMEMHWRARAYELVSNFGLARTGDAITLLKEMPPHDAEVGTRALYAFGEYLLSRISGTVEDEMRAFDRMLELLTRCHEPLVWNACAMHIYLGLQRGMRTRTERYATAVLEVAAERHDTLRDSAISMRIWNRLLAGEYRVAATLLQELNSSQAWNNKPYSVRGSASIAQSLIVFLSGDAEALRKKAADFQTIFEGREGLSWVYWRGLTQVFFGKLHAALGDWDAVQSAQMRLDQELVLFDIPYLRLGRTYLQAVCALNGPE
ncbi:MAG: hypothetical protein WAU86_21795, partial [Oricola sp.]